MLKKIFSVLCMATVILFAATSQVAAAKIVIISDTPTGTFSEPEKAYKAIENTLSKILGKNSGHEIIPAGETESYVQIYREEHDLIQSTGAEQGSYIEQYLKMKDLDNICQYYGGDYIVYTRVTSTIPKIAIGVFSASQKVNVVLDFRVWSNSTKDFTYRRRFTTTGSSTAVYAGLGSSTRALEKGLRKGLQEVEKEASKVRAAMVDY